MCINTTPARVFAATSRAPNARSAYTSLMMQAPAATAAAADMCMRDAVEEARFQDAEAARDANRAVGISQTDRADPMLSPLSEGPGGERGGERHHVGVDADGDGVDDRAGGGVEYGD